MPTAIVLDIDETLCHTIDEDDILTKERPFTSLELRSRLYVLDFNNEGVHTALWGIKRPHVDNFISFCFKNADYVVVWSAGVKEYVEKMINILFTSAGHPRPHFVFSRDHCYDMDGDLIKPLTHLYEFEQSLEEVPLENILILDNKESNFALNIDNGLLIDDYNPKTKKAMLSEDTNLLQAKVQLSRRLYAMQ